MDPTLIYDVGMHTGEDTAYYLHKGYRVVAIDADPDLVAAARVRFKNEISEAKLHIVHAAIAQEEGTSTFWVCDDLKMLNSFDRIHASKFGHPCRAIEVPTLPLRSLMKSHGVPYYLKVDIEGYDHVAVGDITPADRPKYVSMEVTSSDDFFLLKQKGYTKFKCIQQGLFVQLQTEKVSFKSAYKRAVRRIKSLHVANSLRAAVRHLRPAKPASSLNWDFSVCSTGPFGEETAGSWQTMEEALHAWLDHSYKDVLGYFTWYDIHATSE